MAAIVEPRHYIAYGLIALLTIIGIVGAIVHMRRRAQRKLRLRGIKTYERKNHANMTGD